MSAMNNSGTKKPWRLVLPPLLILMGSILMSCGSLSFSNTAQPTVTPTPPDSGSVKVSILNPVTNAVVRVLDQPWVDILADDGLLILQSCGDGQFIAAWSPGFYIATIPCSNGLEKYEFALTPYQLRDNAYYPWVEARNAGQPHSCESCHSNASGMSEYPEWKKDGHATVFRDSYFWTTYLGADISRNRSPNTQWEISGSSRQTRTKPDLSKPYFGPGFKLDYPAENGNCAYCHAPAAVLAAQTQVDLIPLINSATNSQFSVSTEGITCDVCHKVLNVRLAQDNKPFPDKPGALSFDFARPDPGWSQLFTGPLPGANTDGTDIEVTCSPVFSQSQFCAACHYGKFWDTQIYNSYGEWLESPYANSGNEADYKTCQSCHMVVNNGTLEGNTEVKTSARQACSESNVANEDFSHNMMLRKDDNTSALIVGAATLKVDAKKADGQIQTKVRVINERAGHKFPTDSPLRHLILVIEARDENGTLLPQVNGPRIPLWGGQGNNPALDFAGRPGEIYANILMDKDTNITPSIEYWNQTQVISDTRLLPRKAVDSEYAFAAPSNGVAEIIVRLIYRYAFIDIARQKGWNPGDILVAEEIRQVP